MRIGNAFLENFYAPNILVIVLFSKYIKPPSKTKAKFNVNNNNKWFSYIRHSIVRMA